MDKVSERRHVSRYISPGDEYFSEEELKALTPQIVIERIRALKPLIAAHARETELLGRPVDAVWTAIRKTGYFYLAISKKYGGLEATFDEIMDAALPIAEACPATGWLASFSVMNPRSAAGFTEKAQNDIFGNRHFAVVTSVIYPVGQSRKVPGGYRITGRWGWATTVQVADWVSVAAMADGPNGPVLSTFVMPASEIEIDPTWDSHGLIATGTHHIIANDVFVPDYRVSFSSVVLQDWHENVKKLYTYPIYLGPVGASLSLAVAIPVLGIARGALDAYKERLFKHPKRGERDMEATRQTVHVRVAQASAMLRASELMLREAARHVYAAVGLSSEEQVPIGMVEKGMIAYAARLAREAVVMICETTGTSIHYHSSPIQRYLRDMFVGSSHGSVDWDLCMGNAGRILLGLPPIERLAVTELGA